MEAQAKCIRCEKVRMGLPMAYRDEVGDHVGHVCYGCEDEILHIVEAGHRPLVRFLDAI